MDCRLVVGRIWRRDGHEGEATVNLYIYGRHMAASTAARAAGTCTVRSSSPGPRVEIDGARQTGSSYSSACRVCRGVAGLVRFDRGRTIAGRPLARRRAVAMRVNGFWVVDGVIQLPLAMVLGMDDGRWQMDLADEHMGIMGR